MRCFRWFGVAALAAGALLLNAEARADGATSVESFYKDRQIDVVIGSAPGGGFDAYARLVARHMGDYIPGKPTLVPKNLPGAGSAKAAAADGRKCRSKVRPVEVSLHRRSNAAPQHFLPTRISLRLPSPSVVVGGSCPVAPDDDRGRRRWESAAHARPVTGAA